MPISIGIPFYNAEEYLADAIRSVFAQSYQDWELILVDDGSKDRSLEIARSVRDPRVRVLSDGQNRKLPHRLNQITSEAKYDLIARMDADDLISPARLEKELDILEANPGLDLVTTGVCSLSNDDRPVGLRCGSSTAPITGRGLLLGQCPIVHAAMLGRKSWFLRNPYDPSIALAEDYELWLRAYSKGDFKIHVIGEPLYYYREEGNVTAAKMVTAYKNGPKLIRTYGHLGCSKVEQHLMVLKVMGKIATVRFLSSIGRMDILWRRRNRAIDAAALAHSLREIKQIKETVVPGLG